MSYTVTTSKGSNVSTVSRQWASRPAEQRFLDLTSLHAFSKGLADVSRDDAVTLDVAAVEPTADGGLDLLTTAGSASLGNFAFAQLSQRVRAPAHYLATLPAPLAASCLNTGIRAAVEKDPARALALYSTGGVARSVLSPKYTRIFDHEIAASVMKIAGNGTGDARWKVPGVLDWGSMKYDPDVPVSDATTTLFASDRDVFLFLVDDRHPIEVGKLPSGDPDLMFRGFYVWNSEVGARSCGLATMYLRAVCCNRNLWGVEQFQEVTFWHLPTAKQKFVEDWEPALLAFADAGTDKLVAGVAAAKKAIVVPKTGLDQKKLDEDRVAFLRSLTFSVQAADDIIAVHEKEEDGPPASLWDFAQGITAYARDLPFQSARVHAEKLAGKLLDRVNKAVA
ncbi:MAG: hypothetical protein KA761_00325 [Gemmatimonadaceae bacterium]|nr:hypothetical protein [Gemmatimonadaceae bacterium]